MTRSFRTYAIPFETHIPVFSQTLLRLGVSNMEYDSKSNLRFPLFFLIISIFFIVD